MRRKLIVKMISDYENLDVTLVLIYPFRTHVKTASDSIERDREPVEFFHPKRQPLRRYDARDDTDTKSADKDKGKNHKK